MGVDEVSRQVPVGQPAKTRLEPVQTGGIERRAHKTPAGPLVSNPGLLAGKTAETGIPAGVARPLGDAGRTVHETGPLTGHGVFVTAGQVKYAAGECRQVGRPRQKAVIAVDHHKGVTAAHRINEPVQPFNGKTGIEKDLADEDQIEAWSGLARFSKPLLKACKRFGWNNRYLDKPVLLQPGALAAERMELAVACQYPGWTVGGQARQDAADKFMGVRCGNQCFGVGQIQMACNASADIAPDIAQDMLPLSVGQFSGLVPAAQVRIAGDVGPEMMAVGGKMQVNTVLGPET